MIIYTHPVADNFPIKTLVARELLTNQNASIALLWKLYTLNW